MLGKLSVNLRMEWTVFVLVFLRRSYIRICLVSVVSNVRVIVSGAVHLSYDNAGVLRPAQ